MKQGNSDKRHASATNSLGSRKHSTKSISSFINGQSIDYDKLNSDIQWIEPFNEEDFEAKSVDFVGHSLTSDDMSCGSSISSVSSSEYSLGWEFFGEIPATSGGNGTEDEKSSIEQKKPPAREPEYTPLNLPVWGEIEWEFPIELQRIPSLELFIPPIPKKAKPQNIAKQEKHHSRTPSNSTPPLAPRSNSFVEHVTQKLNDIQLDEKENSPGSSTASGEGWTQRMFRSDSLSTSPSGKVGLDIDSSNQSVLSENSIKSEKTIKSGNKSPKMSLGRFSQLHLCNSVASSLSRNSR